jgi:hypothetical protein
MVCRRPRFPRASCRRPVHQANSYQHRNIKHKLTKKSIDTIYKAVQKRGGAGKGDLIPILAVERLKLAVFFLKLAMQTSRPIPDWWDIKRCTIEALADQKLMEEEYLSSKDPEPNSSLCPLTCTLRPHALTRFGLFLPPCRDAQAFPLPM